MTPFFIINKNFFKIWCQQFTIKNKMPSGTRDRCVICLFLKFSILEIRLAWVKNGNFHTELGQNFMRIFLVIFSGTHHCWSSPVSLVITSRINVNFGQILCRRYVVRTNNVGQRLINIWEFENYIENFRKLSQAEPESWS